MPHLPYEIIDQIRKRLSFQDKFIVSILIRDFHMRNKYIQDIKSTSMDYASFYGQFYVLNWWKNRKMKNKKLKLIYSRNAMNYASMNGHVAILQWWKDSRLECKWSEWAMDKASENGHIDVLNWWKNSGFECKWSENAINLASKFGHADVLQWWEKFLQDSIPTN
jgi:hypothetical protein